MHTTLQRKLTEEAQGQKWSWEVDGTTVVVEFHLLPPNTTSLIQPMDQSIFWSLKSRAREEVRARVVEDAGKHPGMKSRIEDSLTVEEAVLSVHNQWMGLKQECIMKAWGPLLWFHWDDWDQGTRNYFGCPDAPPIRSDRMHAHATYEKRILGQNRVHFDSDAAAEKHMLFTFNNCNLAELSVQFVEKWELKGFFALLAKYNCFGPIQIPAALDTLREEVLRDEHCI
jgi:hypothetical protein